MGNACALLLSLGGTVTRVNVDGIFCGSRGGDSGDHAADFSEYSREYGGELLRPDLLQEIIVVKKSGG